MRIGRFEVLEELGRGGMGVVYRAHDPTLDRPVAIKTLSLVTEEHLERFRLEARAAGRLTHPNITVIHEVGDDRGAPFIVMEYLDGASLKSHLQHGGLPLPDRLDAVRQVCLGLHYAHGQGVTAHRDIKPANIQVTGAGVAKIMDFGIARLADQLDLTHNLTQANTVLGTLYYLSPEQIRGERLDGRSDLWSLGVVLHELLYGERPFQDDDEDGVMMRIVTGELPELPRLGLPAEEELRAIVRRALARDRDRRFATGAEMGAAVAAYQRMLAGEIAPPPRPASLAELLGEGRGRFESGQYDRAAEAFERALALEPGSATARNCLVVCRQAERRRRDEELYRTGLLLFRNREYGVAAAAFEELLEHDPANEEARTLVAWSRRERARLEERRAGLDDLLRDALDGPDRDEPEMPADPPPGRPRAAPDPPPPAAAELAPVETRDRSASRVSAWFRRLFSR